MPLLIALLVVIVVTLGVFALVSLLDQRSSRARIIKDRLAAVQKTPDQPVEDVALLRDEQLSQIPALDAFLRRSERISAIQIMLAQGDTNMRAGNFLALCGIIAAVAGLAAFIWSDFCTPASIACGRTWSRSCTATPTPSSRSAWCGRTSCGRSFT